MRQRLSIPMLALIAALGTCSELYCSAFEGAASAMLYESPASESHLVSGTVHKIHGAEFSLENRNQQTVQVDAAAAIQAQRCVTLYEGLVVSVQGTVDKRGVLHAEIVNRIKNARAMWPDDK